MAKPRFKPRPRDSNRGDGLSIPHTHEAAQVSHVLSQHCTSRKRPSKVRHCRSVPSAKRPYFIFLNIKSLPSSCPLCPLPTFMLPLPFKLWFRAMPSKADVLKLIFRRPSFGVRVFIEPSNHRHFPELRKLAHHLTPIE